MPEFKDNQGRVWQAHVACAEIEDVRKSLGIDLLDPKQFDGVVNDPVAVASVLACCCGLDARDVEPLDFKRAIWGDVVDDARNALMEAVIRFFPGRARREAMTRAMDKMLARERSQRQSAGDGSSTPAPESSA